MTVTYREENFRDVYEDFAELFKKHWEEIANNKNEIKLSVDYDGYIQLDKLGKLHLVTARDDGKLIGYTMNFVIRHFHYKDNLFGINDILFVSPEYRRGGVGMSLLKYNEQSLFAKGIEVFHLHMKTAHDFSALLQRLGYREIEKIYEKTNFKE